MASGYATAQFQNIKNVGATELGKTIIILLSPLVGAISLRKIQLPTFL